MKIIFLQIIMMSLLIILLLFILNFSSKKNYFYFEKNSPFECGFDPKNSARLPFSLQFFLIAVIFVIFDVELTLLFPLIIIMMNSNLMNISMLLIFFSTILLLGLFHEQNQGALNWVK
uniref:NADH-ubiquinone oxidoreductase chain 3 n=1 Tax=Curculionoidea sp. 18 KM-2017 TaxID=2219401 RepID=A0A346RGN8_9CUCU|nr:NADH dehydrogenase subunit 3 [Curculionoidea sp. 18 KM-2017]